MYIFLSYLLCVQRAWLISRSYSGCIVESHFPTRLFPHFSNPVLCVLVPFMWPYIRDVCSDLLISFSKSFSELPKTNSEWFTESHQTSLHLLLLFTPPRVAALEAACSSGTSDWRRLTRSQSVSASYAAQQQEVAFRAMPLTATRLTQKLRDREDEIFELWNTWRWDHALQIKVTCDETNLIMRFYVDL